MTTSLPRGTVAEIASAARPLSGSPADFDALLELAADRRYVLLGEASHGTHEFYRARAEITKRLIREFDVAAVAIEGDWPDAYRVNRYVRGATDARDAEDALGGFARFPQWMWRNADVLDFVGWLRAFNEQAPARAAGFYGLDLYSLHASIGAVLAYLRQVDPDAALRAMRRYACFAHYSGDPQRYGYATGIEMEPTCEAAVVQQLVELRARSARYATRDGRMAEDDHFFAEQNARVVVNAEQYYRAMYWGGAVAWNLRDRHMAATLESLVAFLRGGRSHAKVVVWAHNSHLGDARETEVSRQGEVNLGQLVRQAHGADALLVGFTTYEGSVTAASDWDGVAEHKRVRPALPDSVEALFHETLPARCYVDLHRDRAAHEALSEPRLQRAIGVIYRPETERLSHYLRARLSRQFDAVFHYDRTRAVEPLERTAHWERGEAELPETYPSSL